jgi:hypothetical protein
MTAQTWDPALGGAGCVQAIRSALTLALDRRGVDGEAFTSALDVDSRAEYLREVRDALEPKLRDASGTWIADYVRLRFAASKLSRDARSAAGAAACGQ